MPTPTELKQQQRDIFLAYAKKIFDNVIPPEKNSMSLVGKVNVKDENEGGLFYELFSYGYHTKLSEYTKSGDSFKMELANDPIRFFHYISEYIQATGHIPILRDTDKDSEGNITNFHMHFEILKN